MGIVRDKQKAAHSNTRRCGTLSLFSKWCQDQAIFAITVVLCSLKTFMLWLLFLRNYL